MELVLEDLAVAMGQRVVDPQEERYGLSWPGKAAAVAMQEPDARPVLRVRSADDKWVAGGAG